MDIFQKSQHFLEQLSSDYNNRKHNQIVTQNKAAHEKKIASAKRAAKYEEIYGGGTNRTDFTAHQCFALEKEFSQHTYIGRFRRDDMADELNLTSNQIRVWFRNRRARIFDKPKNDVMTKENRRPASTTTSIQQPRIQPQQFRTTSIQKPRIQPQQSNSINQPVPSRNLFGTLPHLMDGMSLTENANNCGNLHHNFSCRCNTFTFIRTLDPNVKLQVGPVKSHRDTRPTNAPSVDYASDFFHRSMHSTYAPSDYEDDFFTCYNN